MHTFRRAGLQEERALGTRLCPASKGEAPGLWPWAALGYTGALGSPHFVLLP